jgi:hypothetical protein
MLSVKRDMSALRYRALMSLSENPAAGRSGSSLAGRL